MGEVIRVGTDMPQVCKPMAVTSPNCFFSDFGFKMSEDLSLEVCVPDPEFSGKSYSPPVPCPVGSTYRRTRGYVSQQSPWPGTKGSALGLRAERATGFLSYSQVLRFQACRSQGAWAIFGIKMFTNSCTFSEQNVNLWTSLQL